MQPIPVKSDRLSPGGRIALGITGLFSAGRWWLSAPPGQIRGGMQLSGHDRTCAHAHNTNRTTTFYQTIAEIIPRFSRMLSSRRTHPSNFKVPHWSMNPARIQRARLFF